MRMEKVKSSVSVRKRLEHNTRERTKAANIDRDRSGRNLTQGGSVDEVMERYKSRLPEKVRKNAVHAVELVMTASPEFAGDWAGYLKACEKWAGDLFGKENFLSVTHHLDEMTPHAHILVMPLKDGKLNANFFIGGSRDRMAELQDDFYKAAGQAFGFDRGQPSKETRARHTPHTLAFEGAKLNEREKKIKEKEENIKKIMGKGLEDFIALRKEMDTWGKKTQQDLTSLATQMRANKCETVENYYLLVEKRKREREQQNLNGGRRR